MRTKAVLFFLLLLPVYVVNGQDDKREYLKKVLNNLEQIKSATYKVEGEVWNPGDTIPSSITSNPQLSSSASFLRLNVLSSLN